MKQENFDFRTIRSFEDACKKEKIDPTVLPDVTGILPEFSDAIVNAYKLMVIYKAINNGCCLDWNNSKQRKYFPYFGVLSSGYGFSDSSYYYYYTHTTVGSRLCTDTSEKACYIAEQFGEEYKEFFLYKE